MTANTATPSNDLGLAVLSQSLEQLTQSYCRLLESQTSLDFCKESGQTIRCLISQFGNVLQAIDDESDADEFDLNDENVE